MATTAGTHTMAHAELERLELAGQLAPGLRYEIINGELVIRGAPNTRHERAVSALAIAFAGWVRSHGGSFFTGLAIEIAGQQLRPDFCVLGPQRAGEIDDDGLHVPPDLVVEVTSPGSRSLDLYEKRDVYQRLGVAEYWVVDLAEDAVSVFHLDAAGGYVRAQRPTDGALVPRVAPEVAVPVAELLSG